MKKATTFYLFLALLTSTAAPALAAATIDTTKVYNSGFLVLTFLGFCAMIVVSKLLPAIGLMVGSLRNALKNVSEEKAGARVGL